MSHAQTISYVWFSQAFLIIAMMGADPELAALIRSGNIAYELARPVDLYTYWLARAWATRAAPVALRAPPIILFAILIGQLSPPASVGHALLAIVALFLGLTVAATIFATVTISLLWTVSGEGLDRIGGPLVFFLSGMVLPLPFFPAWAQPIIRALPFRGMIDVPFRIYLGDLSHAEIVVGLMQQIVWIVIFCIIGRLMLRLGLKRLVIQGG
jgi:ABC-2 type transport system permease protein